MARQFAIIGCFMCLWIITACSSSPVEPATSASEKTNISGMNFTSQQVQDISLNRYLWGYWNMRWDPSTGKMEAIPMRDSQLHLNIRRFLEDTMCKTCLVIGDNFINDDGNLDVMIGIIHPLTDPAFTGFDVRGIAIFPGTYYFDENGLLISRHENDEFTLVKPDGFTSLWSPTKYPPGSLRPIFEYSKGKMAFHTGTLATTLNPYMQFYTLPERRVFQANNHNERHYVIRFPKNPLGVPLEFGYAVDASWAKPSTMTNPKVPGDFPPDANSIEAWRVDLELSGLVTPLGGSALAIIRVYDWQGLSTIASVSLEGPDLFNGKINATWQLNSGNYAQYTATIPNELKAKVGEYPILVTVEDTQTVAVLGKINAYNVGYLKVRPVIEFKQQVTMENLPVDSVFDQTTGNAYFSPVPLKSNLSLMGINASLTQIKGFPKMVASGGIGICSGTRQIFAATDLGTGWSNDVTVLDIDTKDIDYTFDIPSLSGNPGSGPIDFIVNENTQEVWVTLFYENQVALFPANTPNPNLIRVQVGTGPTTLALDQFNYRVFVVSDGNDTISIIDGFSHTNLGTIPLKTPLVSPDPILPSLPGMVYVSSKNRLYITTLLEGSIDYYNMETKTYEGSIQLAPKGTEIIVGLVYDEGTGYLYATGQVVSGKGHVWAIDPQTNQKIVQMETSGMNPSFPCINPISKRLFVPDPIGFVDVFVVNK